MRLLWLKSDVLLPLDTGGKLRTWHLLRHLALRHDITYLGCASPDQPQAELDGMREVARTVHVVRQRHTAKGTWRFYASAAMHLADPLPYAVGNYRSRAYRRRVEALLRDQRFDLIVCDFLVPAVNLPRRLPCPSVLFTHNVEAEIFRRHAETARDPLRRAVWRSQATKMARYERGLLGRFDAVVAVAERDREYFGRAYGANNVSVIPTGVDLDYFSYSATPVLEPADPATVVFTGSMDWMANIDGIEYFLDQVWPEVARVRPEAKFVVVGRQPPAALVERAASRGLNWEFTGFVDDVRPYVRRAHVYVIPLRVGGGTRIKVYEAMALGCPVVSTRIGVEGLPVQDGSQFMAADRPADMAASILSLLARNDERSQLSAAARRFVEETVSTASAAKVFEQICQHALRRAHTR
jgi:glycosyltransferase involved in cell wall biosynthesis